MEKVYNFNFPLDWQLIQSIGREDYKRVQKYPTLVLQVVGVDNADRNY